MSINSRVGSDADRREIIALQEDHFVDLKSKDIAPAILQKHFVAFANTDGGELFVGVADPKEKGPRIRGFSKPEDVNDIITTLSETEPTVDGVEFELLTFRPGGLVLRIAVPKSPRVHYTNSKDCYIRRNASSGRIRGDQITKLSYAKGSFSYEGQASSCEAEEIVRSAILYDYLKRIGSHLDPESFLRKQRLIVSSDDGPERATVAAVLLFHDEPQAVLGTRCAIKVYRLQTTDRDYKREHLAEMPTTIEGPLEAQIKQVIDRVSQLLSDATVNVGGALVPLSYPADALFEILVNAVIHRDYSVADDIHVRIYDNRIEIQSPGRLPGAVTIDNLLDERYSRNPKIVRLLHKLPNPPNHDIGEGLNTANNALRKAGLVPPTFEELETAFQVTVEHKRIASLEDTIVEYLRANETVSNKTIRGLSGEASENRVKKAFQTLRSQDVIEPVDPQANPFHFRYKRGSRYPNE